MVAKLRMLEVKSVTHIQFRPLKMNGPFSPKMACGPLLQADIIFLCTMADWILGVFFPMTIYGFITKNKIIKQSLKYLFMNMENEFDVTLA